jgi:Flp pilus assembly pilin Flp
MINTLKRFWNDESGPELVEWAVVTIILLVAAVILYIAVGRALGGVICAIECWIAAVKSRSGQDDANKQSCADETKDSCEEAS